MKYPEITAQLSGQDGNVFNLIGIVKRALRKGGVSSTECDEFVKEITASGSYDEALQIMMKWCNVE